MTQMHNPPHPGEVLKDAVFFDAAFSTDAFAKQIGLAHDCLLELLNGKLAVGPDLAGKLAEAVGGTQQTWLRLQENYEYWQQHRHPRPLVPV
jgi:addiction module HigA family antidote